MIPSILIAAVLTVANICATGDACRITAYYPHEDHWGNTVADPNIMCHGDPGIESWSMRWCAVNNTRKYPFGSVLWVEDYGLWVVHDHCPQSNTVDFRVPKQWMILEWKRVWRLW